MGGRGKGGRKGGQAPGGGQGKCKGKTDAKFKTPPPPPQEAAQSFSWTCGYCESSVSLRHQWCWQCGRHWEASRPADPG
eukprot:6365234-Pyramimonas_sp.AAC.1